MSFNPKTRNPVHPKLSRGIVWCKECRSSHKVNSAQAMRSGWPKCCGYTMTVDSPAERGQTAKGGGE